MRLFPTDYAGLHPAYPTWPEKSVEARVGFARGTLDYGLFAGTIACVGRLLSRTSQVPPSLIKIAAYAGVIGVGLDSFVHRHRAEGEKSFLRANGIRAPDNPIFDRIGYFDSDDAVLAGGLAGLMVAIRTRKIPSVTGWKRYAGLTTVGIGGGTAAFVLKNTADRYIFRSNTELMRERGQVEAIQSVSMEWLRIREQAVIESFARTFGKFFKEDASTVAEPFQPQVSGNSRSPPAGGVLLTETVEVGRLRLTTRGQDLLVTVKESEGHSPSFSPDPIYSQPATTGVSELQKRVEDLRARRQQLTQESKFLWALLAEREADYYNSPQSKSDSPSRKVAVFGLQMLGSAHRLTWNEICKLDWDVARIEKTIEQRLSARSNANGQVVWRPRDSDTAPNIAPNLAISTLQSPHMALVNQVTNQLERMRRIVAAKLAGPDDVLDKTVQVPILGLGDMARKRELLVESKKALDEALKEHAEARKTTEQILTDLKQASNRR